MSIGTDTYIDKVLREYVPPEEQVQTFPEELLEDETNVLLYAVLTELQTLRRTETGSRDIRALLQEQQQETRGEPDAEATYYTQQHTLRTGESLEHIDLDFVATEVDIRCDVAIEVAFANPGGQYNRIDYEVEDFPVVGIPVETSNIWIRNTDSSDGVAEIEAWGDA